VSALEETAVPRAALQIRSLKGHRVLSPIISQKDLDDEIFREATHLSVAFEERV
jgi:hypothetical protein